VPLNPESRNEIPTAVRGRLHARPTALVGAAIGDSGLWAFVSGFGDVERVVRGPGGGEERRRLPASVSGARCRSCE
jgi:hypothetical protein